jgi:hypothetical protein
MEAQVQEVLQAVEALKEKEVMMANQDVLDLQVSLDFPAEMECQVPGETKEMMPLFLQTF